MNDNRGQMLTSEKIQEVLDDLNLYKSIRSIAKKHHVSEGTVYRIDKGKLTVESRQEKEELVEGKIATQMVFWKPHSRCKGCGAKVQKPCLLCAVRNKDWASITDILINEDHSAITL